MNLLEQRTEIDELIGSHRLTEARTRLASLWFLDCSPTTAAFVVSRFERMKNQLELTNYRLAILRSFTIEPIIPLLKASAFAAGIDLCIHLGDFNAYAPEILDVNGSLYAFAPDAVILAVQTCDIAPDLWRDSADWTGETASSCVTRVTRNFEEYVRAFRTHCQSHLIVHNLEHKSMPSRGVLDSQVVEGQAAAVDTINRELRKIISQQPSVYLLDYDALVARHGRLSWRDERKWVTFRMPIAADHLVHVAQEWLRFLQPLAGRVAKALVVDLDNTLWGGVVGEDGINGILLGLEHPGSIYQNLQRTILDLHKRGILLAICSKNNPEDALEVLKEHPGMCLRPEHFAAMRINWKDKADNLRELAAELNIGVDSLVFLDDSPAERQRIRSELPEVLVIELPEDCSQFERVLRECPAFERLRLSEEDHRRNAYYAQRRESAELERRAGASKEEFYRELRQQVEIVKPASATIKRIAQLAQKTNQFNLTTKRYTEQEVSTLNACPDWQVTGAKVVDRFGDNGLVGVAITRYADLSCEIDSFILSCRVIGRTVETALLSHIVGEARSRGANFVRGWFFPTKKNAPAKDFYLNHGFRMVCQDGDRSLWELDLLRAEVSCPSWIRLVHKGNAKV